MNKQRKPNMPSLIREDILNAFVKFDDPELYICTMNGYLVEISRTDESNENMQYKTRIMHNLDIDGDDPNENEVQDFYTDTAEKGAYYAISRLETADEFETNNHRLLSMNLLDPNAEPGNYIAVLIHCEGFVVYEAVSYLNNPQKNAIGWIPVYMS